MPQRAFYSDERGVPKEAPMKTMALLSTAAAVLLIGAGAANAQSAKDQAAPERAPAAQRSAPAEKVAPSMNAGERKTPETTGQGASGESKAGTAMEKGGTTGAAPKSDKPDMNKSDKSDKTGMKSEDRSKKSSETAKDNDRGGSKASETKSSESKSENKSTTGQGAAAGKARLSGEQRTKITTIIRKHRVAPAHLNISVRVGARVPGNVHFYPLPMEVVEVYPQWRGYDYILVGGGDILVVDPRTHEIVAVLPA
jgi:hypothetical protein